MTGKEYDSMGEAAAAQTQKKQLFGKLKAMADQLRSNMDASEFKNYVLGIVFYRFLSESLVLKFKEITRLDYIDSFKEDEAASKKMVSEQLRIGYFIEPKFLWPNLIARINAGKFTYVELEDATRGLLASTVGKGSQKDFSNLFDDLNLESEKIGHAALERTELISKIMKMVDSIEFGAGDSRIDILGDAYEFFLGDFAAASGKKGGEFYTPVCMAKLVAKLALNGKSSFEKAYDPCCGSTGLLLAVKDEIPEGGHLGKLYGQEMNPTTYNLGRMNMLLHGVPFSGFDVFNGDTINHPQAEKTQEEKENGISDLSLLADSFDVIVANPPFSQDYTPTDTLLSDPRFAGPGVLAPKSYEDWLFVDHMLYCLKPGGTLAVVLAQGPLFRGGAEEKIRKYVVDNRNWLDSVIGVPEKCFYGTSIATVICVFKKDKISNGIYFVDASKDFIPGTKQNSLNDEQIQRIVNACKSKAEIAKYAHLATYDELKVNDFNLNIPRYVDVSEEEEKIDIEAVRKDVEKAKVKDEELEKKIADLLSQVDEIIDTNDRLIEDLAKEKEYVLNSLFSLTRTSKCRLAKITEISSVDTGSSNANQAKGNGSYAFFDRGLEEKRFDTYEFDGPSIIYNGEGSKFIPIYFDGKLALHQRCYIIHNVSKDIGIKYLYYFLQTQNKHFCTHSVGTTVMSLRRECFETCAVPVYDPQTQARIASVLSDIDRRIEIRKRLADDWRQIKKNLLANMFC